MANNINFKLYSKEEKTLKAVDRKSYIQETIIVLLSCFIVSREKKI